MNRIRHSKPPNYRRNEAGQYLCVWRECGKVLKGKLKYCGDACRREVYIRCYPDEMRDYIECRDKGVCAKCGCDTAQLARIIEAFKASLGRRYDGRREARRLLAGIGFNLLTEHLWEADHIVQWADGGSNEPENLRTLCLPCHKQATKEYAGRRAAAKRESKRAEIILPLFG